MIIVYTICTTTYLSQTYVLANSLLIHNPAFKFVIGIIDGPKDDIIDIFPKNVEIINVEELQIEDCENMRKRYKTNEFCFSLKPFYALFLLDEYKNCDKIIYLDSDVFVFGSFNKILFDLDQTSILLSPHSTKPNNEGIDDERNILNSGNFNAGFLGIKRSEDSFIFLKWWAQKLKKECIGSVGDQVWLNLVPLYFSNISIEKNIAVNLGYWRLHEIDKIIFENNTIFVNNEPLIFFHYSGFDYQSNRDISGYSNYTKKAIPGIDMILNQIAFRLIEAEKVPLIKDKVYTKKYVGFKGKAKLLLIQMGIYYYFSQSKKIILKVFN